MNANQAHENARHCAQRRADDRLAARTGALGAEQRRLYERYEIEV